jgi:MoxR-like ATPase
MSKKLEQRAELRDALFSQFGECESYDRNDILAAAESVGQGFPNWILNATNRVSRGMYAVPDIGATTTPRASKSAPTKMRIVKTPTVEAPVQASLITDSDGFNANLIPDRDNLYVSFGYHTTVRNIIKSRMFYPVFITGLSGNGKTKMVEQTCAETRREVIRVNFTIETDEDDLIGGFRLVNGETKFFKGPVIKAMERGAVLLCDEIDLANPAKVMCLQSILEGSGYFIKKTGEFITPAHGFTVVATANTKGKGSDDGQFIGTNILNEAFLERFPITVEQQYPAPTVEKKILSKVFESLDLTDVEFIDKLVDWADIIRKTYMDDGVDEIISTRRLVHISRAYAIFGDRAKAIELCINRFDEDTKVAFADLYLKLDDQPVENAGVEESRPAEDY